MSKKINEWDGKGEYPPAGSTCVASVTDLRVGRELLDNRGEEAVIVLADEQGCVFDIKENRFYLDYTDYKVTFKPLKSKEDEKRDKAINEMAEIIFGCDNTTIDQRHLIALHEAGYRKVNELSDEDIRQASLNYGGGITSLDSISYRTGAKWARKQILGE